MYGEEIEWTEREFIYYVAPVDQLLRERHCASPLAEVAFITNQPQPYV